MAYNSKYTQPGSPNSHPFDQSATTLGSPSPPPLTIEQIMERESQEKKPHVHATEVRVPTSPQNNTSTQQSTDVQVSTSVSKREQAWELFKPMFGHFIFNCILWAIFYNVMLYTKHKGVLTRKQKHTYNVFIIGLPLIIGIHTAVSASPIICNDRT